MPRLPCCPDARLGPLPWPGGGGVAEAWPSWHVPSSTHLTQPDSPSQYWCTWSPNISRNYVFNTPPQQMGFATWCEETSALIFCLCGAVALFALWWHACLLYYDCWHCVDWSVSVIHVPCRPWFNLVLKNVHLYSSPCHQYFAFHTLIKSLGLMSYGLWLSDKSAILLASMCFAFFKRYMCESMLSSCHWTLLVECCP